MRLVVISDTHSMHEWVSVPCGDVLIHAGDITRSGSLEELEAFNHWLGTLDFGNILVIAGNHDFCFESENAIAREALSNAIYLEDESIAIDGVKFYGSPWQPEHFDWAFNLPRGEPLKRKWDLIPAETDVLITHGPPFGCGDQTIEGERVGCSGLAEFIEKNKPVLSLCGHIHEGYGACWLGDTFCINASFIDELGFGNDPVIVDLTKGHDGECSVKLANRQADRAQ